MVAHDATLILSRLKALLAAEIVGVLKIAHFHPQGAGVTGIDYGEFARSRNAKPDRFTINRLVIILNRLGKQVDVDVSVQPGGSPTGAAHPRELCLW